jgi:hypothetical protein
MNHTGCEFTAFTDEELNAKLSGSNGDGCFVGSNALLLLRAPRKSRPILGGHHTNRFLPTYTKVLIDTFVQ